MQEEMHEFDHQCPHCGNDHRGFLSTHDRSRKPRPGDYAVCVFCASIMVMKPTGMVELVGADYVKAITSPSLISRLLVAQSRVFGSVTALRYAAGAADELCACGHPKASHTVPYETNLSWSCAEPECECFEFRARQ